VYDNVLVMILAGGEGRRLQPLTRERAKPAVPYGGRYRLIDIVLSNFVNSKFYKIKVLTQYKSNSLNTHLNRAWRLSAILDQYIEPVPAQQNLGPQWYEGSADAIYQNLNIITDEEPDYVCVFGADHVYRMDVRQMLEHHIEKDAELTVAGIPVPLEQARAFGVIGVDDDMRMIEWEEKPDDPTPMPSKPTHAFASMGNYIFSTEALVRELHRDAETESSVRDFGRSIITEMYTGSPVYVYDFATNVVPGQGERERGYWRDVGTLHAYYTANMDLISIHPEFSLYNKRWPIRTHYEHNPPAKFVHATGDRIGVATNSLVSDGCIISGGRIDRSVLFPGVRVNSFSQIEESILFQDVDVGRHARVRNAIIDKDVHIPAETEIGYDLEADRERFTVDEHGHVVIPKGYRFD